MRQNPVDRPSMDRYAGPLLILLVGAVLYLPLVGQLGFYRDDWHVVWGAITQGTGKIIDLHLTDRPFMGVIYSLTYSILGSSPLIWQLYVVFLRILSGFLFLWLARLLWPRQRLATTLMALLFVIYPGFLQMQTSTAYSNHLVGLNLGILSIALSIRVTQLSRRFQQVLLTSLAVLSGMGCYMIMEYMVGLEAVRILLLGYVLFRWQFHLLRKKALGLFTIWLPHLLALAAFLFWRVFLFKSARSVTDVGALSSRYLSDPGFMLVRAVVETIKGTLNALVLSWVVPFYNLTMQASVSDLLASFLLAALAVALLWAFLRFAPQAVEMEEDSAPGDRWSRDAVWLGLLVALINLVPIVLANRDIRLTDTLDRYTLPASMGGVMLWIGLLFLSIRPDIRRVFLFAALVISVFTHYNNAAFFRNFWSLEKQLWWQLSWRAPDIKKDAVVIPYLPAPYSLAESYESWGPANLIYGTPSDPLRVVGEALNMESLHSIIDREHFGRTMRRVSLQLDFKNSLVLSIPRPGACLRVHDADWLEFSENESPLVRQVATRSRADLVITQGEQKSLPAVVFGKEPEHGWCYYYEKAALARQNKDWKEVARLGDEVTARGLTSSEGAEWMPFYQGYAYEHRMDDANRTAEYIRGDEIFRKTFCQQFSKAYVGGLRKGSIDEFVIINLCPQ